MDKFSQIKSKSKDKEKDDDVLFSNDYMDIVDYEGWTIVKECDFVVCIPCLMESNQIIMRYEYIPTFKYVDGQEHHLTVLSGCIEGAESKETTLLRELEEEAGIVLRPGYKIEFMKPLFVSKSHTSKYHPCILSLSEKDYHEVIAKGDGSKEEKNSKSVKLDSKFLNSINSSDLITEYMVNEVKKYLNFQ